MILALAVIPASAATTHTVTATFNYDFTVDNSCTATVTTGCLASFNVYDTTGSTPVKLFSIPAPAGQTGPVTGITGTSGPITLKSGNRSFVVTAVMADGTESVNSNVSNFVVKPFPPTSNTEGVN